MVMEDPDRYAMTQTVTIDIFVPGKLLERHVSRGQVLRVVGYVLLGLGLMVLISALMLVPLIAMGVVHVNLRTGQVEPFSVLILLSASELALIVPPLWYVKKRGLPAASIGIKKISLPSDILYGLGLGLVMFLANVAVSWAVDMIPGVPEPGSGSLSRTLSIWDVAGWALVMFVIVGPAEEVLFRGFLQRRLEMYFFGHRTRYGAMAIAIASLIFAATHLDIIGLPTRFVLGAFLGFAARRRRYSVVAPSVAHGLNNTLVLLFYLLLP